MGLTTWKAWAFALATHRRDGYRTVLAPDFLHDLSISLNLLGMLSMLEGERPGTFRTGVFTMRVDTPTECYFTLFHAEHPQAADGTPLLDEGSRPAFFVRGVAFRQPVPDRVAVDALAACAFVSESALAAFWQSDRTYRWPKISDAISVAARDTRAFDLNHEDISRLGRWKVDLLPAAELALQQDRARSAGVWGNAEASQWRDRTVSQPPPPPPVAQSPPLWAKLVAVAVVAATILALIVLIWHPT